MKTILALTIISLCFFGINSISFAQIHFETQVNKSENDAEENLSDGDVNITSSDLELCYDPGVIGIGSKDQYIGIRFESIDIPKTAIVDSAFIQFTAEGSTNDPTLVEVYGELMFNSPVFSSSLDYNISARTRTSNFVNWNIPEWNINDATTENERTPNLNTLVEEIIQQSLWQRNNSMSFIIEGSGTRRAYSYDESSSKASVLHIYYRENNASVSSFTKSEVKCYPNPASDFIYVDLTKSNFGEDFTVEVLSMCGQNISTQHLKGGEKHKLELNKNHQLAILRITSASGVYTQKIINK